MRIFSVIVTYNRRALLERCLLAVVQQTRRPDAVIVVDNASTDGTGKWLDEWLAVHILDSRKLTLPENLGGAGGFAAGLQQALAYGADWVWMMDDDAEPHPDALMELMRVTDNPANIYGSLATSGTETSWTISVLGERQRRTRIAQDVPEQADVQMLPFLGFFIHRELVNRIGLPDAGYFIAADDFEYCVRARNAGARIIVAGRSRIEHPKARQYAIGFSTHRLTGLELPPWKRYYDTRNRLLTARRHPELHLYSRTLPGSFARLVAALVREPRRLAQLWAWCCGTFDGLRGVKGMRHKRWRLGP